MQTLYEYDCMHDEKLLIMNGVQLHAFFNPNKMVDLQPYCKFKTCLLQ